MFIKTIMYDDKLDEYSVKKEAELLMNASLYGFAPEVYNVIYEKNKARIVMEKIDGLTISEVYGTDSADVPQEIWEKILNILNTLYNQEKVEYIDISPYNFMIKDGNIYIIDFGHAYYINENKEIDWFLKEFMDGDFCWNPDFK